MHKSKIELPEEKRKTLIELLNARLADAIDLRSQAKQAHWNVKGPSFIALHKLFDEVADAVADYSDLIAERAIILGGNADGTIGAVAKNTKLPPYPTNIKEGLDHADALSTALASFARVTRAAIKQSEELGDMATSDLFTEVTRGLDKYRWFVEAHLQAER